MVHLGSYADFTYQPTYLSISSHVNEERCVFSYVSYFTAESHCQLFRWILVLWLSSDNSDNWRVNIDKGLLNGVIFIELKKAPIDHEITK